MTPLALVAVAGLAGLLAGYAAGRLRPGRRLVAWAQDQAERPGLHPRLLLAAPVILVALALVWTFHPRRTIANRRSWNPEDTLTVPVPTYEPRWADRRGRAL